MKRITAIVMAAMLMTILSVSTVFAAASDGFQLEKDKCSPTDGYKKGRSYQCNGKALFYR